MTVLVAAACTTEDAVEPGVAPSPTPPRGEAAALIAFQGPLTGPDAAIGASILRGIQLAVEGADVNGGIEVLVLDSTGVPDQAAAQAEEASRNEALVAVVGPALSEEVAAAGPVWDQSGIPFVSPSAAATDLTARGWRWFFRTAATDRSQGEVAARFLRGSLELEVVALVGDSTESSREFLDSVQNTFELTGGTIAERLGFESPHEDFVPFALQVVATGAQAVVFAGESREGALFRRQLHEVAGDDVVFVGGPSIVRSEFVSLVGAQVAEGSFATFPSADPTWAGAPFLAAYRTAYDADPGPFTLEAYQATRLLIEAVERVGADRQAIRDYLDRHRGEVFGRWLAFLPSGDVADQAVFVYEVVDGFWTQREAFSRQPGTTQIGLTPYTPHSPGGRAHGAA